MYLHHLTCVCISKTQYMQFLVIRVYSNLIHMHFEYTVHSHTSHLD